MATCGTAYTYSFREAAMNNAENQTGIVVLWPLLPLVVEGQEVLEDIQRSEAIQEPQGSPLHRI